jgi:hypothetical protein
MSEMILNEASAAPDAWTVEQASMALVDISKGMAALVSCGFTPAILRMQHQMHEIKVAVNGSLWDVLQHLRMSRQEMDATRFLQRLAQKMPLIVDLPASVVDRFHGCEPAAPHASNADALVLCAHLGGVAISLPTHPGWDVDRLTIHFLELLSDGAIVEATETVDNLARASHAVAILGRNRQRKLERLTLQTFWQERANVYPSLRFGLDVEDFIRTQGSNFGTVARRLADIDVSAANWQSTGGGVPIWTTDVTPESQSVLNSPTLRQTRCFRDANGASQLFDWHARFGSGGRIHLRFDPSDRSIEIGYIGPHLPL